MRVLNAMRAISSRSYILCHGSGSLGHWGLFCRLFLTHWDNSHFVVHTSINHKVLRNQVIWHRITWSIILFWRKTCSQLRGCMENKTRWAWESMLVPPYPKDKIEGEHQVFDARLSAGQSCHGGARTIRLTSVETFKSSWRWRGRSALLLDISEQNEAGSWPTRWRSRTSRSARVVARPHTAACGQNAQFFL